MAGHPDPRFAALDTELKKYAVAIAPLETTDGPLLVLNSTKQGSGTCVVLGGRFFVATAAHVISSDTTEQFAVLTPSTTDRTLAQRGTGRRGGGTRDELDVGWIELAPRAAAVAGREFLPLERLGPFRTGIDDNVHVCGAPRVGGSVKHVEGSVHFTAHLGTWATRPLGKEDVDSGDWERRMYLEWPGTIPGANGVSYEYPAPAGLSGGGLWALNTEAHGRSWRADQAQLVGIELACVRHGRRYLVGQQIHVWLEMVAEDIPELAPIIKEHLTGGQLSITPAR